MSGVKLFYCTSSGGAKDRSCTRPWKDDFYYNFNLNSENFK